MEVTMEQYKPLEGLKVVELSMMVSAASCGRMLADWGARVIKIESTTGGDNMRRWPATIGVPISDGYSPIFDNLNGCKEGLSVNIKTEQGQEIMYRLLSEADIFITNLRTEALARVKLDYDTLKERFPRLVMTQLDGYGPKGPDAGRAGYDNTAFWARSGFMYSQSIYDGEGTYPVAMPMGFGDVISGMGMLAGTMSAVLAAQETGKGDHVTLSLYGTAVWLANILISGSQFGFKMPKHRENSSPFGATFRCSDGRWFMPQIVNTVRDAPAYYRLLGADDMCDNPVYLVRSNFNNVEICKPVMERFEKIYATKTAREWKDLFDEAGFSSEILYTYADVRTDPQALINDFIYTMHYDNGKTADLVRPNINSRRMGLGEIRRGPMLGENTREILQELGYDNEQIEQMLADGIAAQHE